MPKSEPVHYASPGHIQAAAHLYGIETVALEEARILELGCGAGENLLPYALAYPKARVVGIDLWPEEIEAGRQTASKLGIGNLDLQARIFTEIDDSFGKFDYIIIHDEYVWAPLAIREAFIRICRQNLSQQGIVYVSGNVYPGWKAGDILRDAIQLHNHSADSFESVKSNALALLALMADGLAQQNGQNASILAASRHLARHPEYYLNIDYLQSNNATFYLLDLVNAAAQSGLSYVGDSLPQTELPEAYGQNVQLNHSLLSLGQPKAVRQQYLDFSVNRESRRSLFVHQDRAENILIDPDLDRLSKLRVATSLKRKYSSSRNNDKTTLFINPANKEYAFADPMVIAICDVLGSIWPCSTDSQGLLNFTRHIEPGMNDEDKMAAIQEAVKALFHLGELRYSVGMGPYDEHKNDRITLLQGLKPQAMPEDSNRVELSGSNLWHEPFSIELNPSQLQLIKSLTGSKQVLPSTGPMAYEAIAFIEKLRWHGALTASHSAWSSYYAKALEFETNTATPKLHLLPALVAHSLQSELQKKNTPAARGNAPDPSPSIMHRFEALRGKQEYKQAELLARDCTEKFPLSSFSWHALALALQGQGKNQESLMPFLRAIAIQPRNAVFYSGLATSLPATRSGALPEILTSLALSLNPKNVSALIYLGNLLRGKEKREAAEICYRHALELDPNNSAAHKNLGVVLGELGRVEESILQLEQCVAKHPNDYSTHSNLLFSLSLSASITPTELFKAHRRFGISVEKNAIAKPLKAKSTSNASDPYKRLRLGFVSGDLYNHAVANFIGPVWERLNKDAFEIYAYCNNNEYDAVSAKLKNHTNSWIVVTGMSDRDLAAKIQDDGIDILFDLSGHTGHNRLPMFALKPAPLQITWIGYPATTGLKAMDYYVANKHQAPKGLFDDQFTEKLIRIPESIIFEPAPNSPDVNPLPVLTKKIFTFASFNRINKVNEAMLKTWANILIKTPNSRLLLGHMFPEIIKELKDKIQGYGVSAERLIFQPRTSMDKYLALHHQVDLLLDTFPYNGGTTTFHGLWMGVPTLTLGGASMPSRSGAAIMGTLGLQEFIVENEDDYIASAIKWSTETGRLAEVRAGLRERLENSCFLSPDLTVASIERFLRRAWSLWCSGKDAEPFELQ